MVGRWVSIAAFCVVPLGVTAGSFDCKGHAPNWTLRFDQTQGRFAFPAPTDMDVMHQVQAEGQEWPRAYTLIGHRDTAIVVLQEPVEGTHNVQILTQRAEQPILLDGVCDAVPGS